MANRERITKYFRSVPAPRDFVPVIGRAAAAVIFAALTALALIYSPNTTFGVVVAIAFSGVTAWFGYQTWTVRQAIEANYRRAEMYCFPKATGAEMDDWLTRDLNAAVDDAREAFSLHQVELDREPVVVCYPAAGTAVASGTEEENPILRYATHRILVLFLTTDKRLFLRESQFDSTSGVATQIIGYECRFRDVQGLSSDATRPTAALPMIEYGRRVGTIRYANLYGFHCAGGRTHSFPLEVRLDPYGTHLVRGAEAARRALRSILRSTDGRIV